MDHDKKLSQNDDFEKLLAKEAERCLCLRWVHSQAQSQNATWNTQLVIPIIILSTFAGSAGLAGEGLLPFQGATTLVGMITLLCSMMNTVASQFGFAKKAESHRVAMIQQARIHRFLEMELALPREHRLDADKIMKWMKEETDRLNEIVPLLDPQVISLFRKKFHSDPITKPPELNGLERVHISETTLFEKKIQIKVDGRETVSPRGRREENLAV